MAGRAAGGVGALAELPGGPLPRDVGAALGVAETGSLVFTSGPDNPVTLNFLGETHFAVVAARDIVQGYEEAWEVLKAQQKPRTVNWVTGPSRSADIGQTLQLGAHGPVALQIFLVGEPEG